MATVDGKSWVSVTAFAISAAAISIAAAIFSVSSRRRKCERLASRVRELEDSLGASIEKAASERRGRVRAQKELREALALRSSDGSKPGSCSSYPMAPIGVAQSCFSTRNGTPRQPLLVPLSRACLVLDPSRVPAEALEGLSGYSHCWILYVFHLNTNLEKYWKQPSRSKFKAKVRVPRLKGGKMGVFATRSPHRPCPIGLTVAKVLAVDGHAVLLSGVDLVDGTPILDIKPYLPYPDCVCSATVPEWLKEENALAVGSVSFSVDFPSSLFSCWAITEKHSLYSSAKEFQSLIKEVLSWDIRSLSQKTRPHEVTSKNESNGGVDHLDTDDGDGHESDKYVNINASSSRSLADVTYHLILDGIDISYKIDYENNIMVERATVIRDAKSCRNYQYSYVNWREKLEQEK
ncbi:tRNA (adenine(37)-N6)-methyltransferase [Asparagus officinalis]|uniref:tRNA (Adenine(37)-N6)-methyltransferase n=1 Tax=Asparagus officinalis TaxID=4686 RepID=A0A5P1FVV7_ASPOF|nr:uncharacterized protein LOC109846137 isoform X2 [Asparagus officinalis]ONK81943.1 tRNA (adenine(37)-N6)-methyltransferase [Asparagus officinalis]